MSVLVLAMSLVLLVAVPVLTAIQLRNRRFRWPLVGLSVVLYLLVGNFVSRVLLAGVIYPRDPATSGLTLGQLEFRQFVQSGVSLSAALLVTLVVFAVLRRALPRMDAAPKR